MYCNSALLQWQYTNNASSLCISYKESAVSNNFFTRTILPMFTVREKTIKAKFIYLDDAGDDKLLYWLLLFLIVVQFNLICVNAHTSKWVLCAWTKRVLLKLLCSKIMQCITKTIQIWCVTRFAGSEYKVRKITIWVNSSR